MNFEEIAKKRRSCRHYNEKKVSDGDIKEILETVRLSPSACNSQPWKFVVCKDETAKTLPKHLALSSLLPINRWTKEASTFIVVCETKARLLKNLPVSSQHYAQIDIGIACATLCYAAEEKGISTCIMGAFDEEKIKELLEIPKNVKVRLIVALGYPRDEKTVEKIRKPYDEIVSVNKW